MVSALDGLSPQQTSTPGGFAARTQPDPVGGGLDWPLALACDRLPSVDVCFFPGSSKPGFVAFARGSLAASRSDGGADG